MPIAPRYLPLRGLTSSGNPSNHLPTNHRPTPQGRGSYRPPSIHVPRPSVRVFGNHFQKFFALNFSGGARNNYFPFSNRRWVSSIRMDSGERKATVYLSSLGLAARNFSKEERKLSKTPDFRVFRDDELVFFAEVKTIDPGQWISARLTQSAGPTWQDPTYNRLAAKVHDAARQFEAVNPDGQQANVLIFVNFAPSTTYGDLLSVLTGYLFTEDGRRRPLFAKYSEGRIRDDRDSIDLYVWIDRDDKSYQLFNTRRLTRARRLADCWALNLDEITELK